MDQFTRGMFDESLFPVPGHESIGRRLPDVQDERRLADSRELDRLDFTSLDDRDKPLERNYSLRDFDPALRQGLERDAESFQRQYADDLRGADSYEAGRDFWLTRNHAGSGYWDGDYPEPQASRLTAAAHRFGEVEVYVGDDGKIYSPRFTYGHGALANPLANPISDGAALGLTFLAVAGVTLIAWSLYAATKPASS